MVRCAHHDKWRELRLAWFSSVQILRVHNRIHSILVQRVLKPLPRGYRPYLPLLVNGKEAHEKSLLGFVLRLLVINAFDRELTRLLRRLAVAHRLLAHEDDVRRFLHHPPRDGDGMHDVLETHHRAGATGAVHDAGIERQMSVTVGVAPPADACRLRIFFHHPYRLLYRIESVSP